MNSTPAESAEKCVRELEAMLIQSVADHRAAAANGLGAIVTSSMLVQAELDLIRLRTLAAKHGVRLGPPEEGSNESR